MFIRHFVHILPYTAKVQSKEFSLLLLFSEPVPNFVTHTGMVDLSVFVAACFVSNQVYLIINKAITPRKGIILKVCRTAYGLHISQPQG